jgi:hypothetical protein
MVLGPCNPSVSSRCSQKILSAASSVTYRKYRKQGVIPASSLLVAPNPAPKLAPAAIRDHCQMNAPPLLLHFPGGPAIRKSSQLMLSIPLRRAVSSSPGAVITSGLNAGLRRQNSNRPRSAWTSNRPVLTSTANFPQLPSQTASVSSGCSRQYNTCWPWLMAKARQAFSTQTPNRSGSRAGSGAPLGCEAESSALFSTKSLGGRCYKSQT